MIVTLLAPFDVVNGPSYTPGERVCFADALAQDLINRGIAKQESVMPIPSKTLDAPKNSKMLVAPKAKKGHGVA